MMIASILDRVFRREGGGVLAGLIRFTGDFDLAEDALQDAFARALVAWSRDGLPENPGAWLATAARRRALDLLRRARSAPRANCPMYPFQLKRKKPGRSRSRVSRTTACDCSSPAATPRWLNQRRWRSRSARSAAFPRATSPARFVEPEATTAQRLVRAKQKIRDARIPYEIPRQDDLPDRLAAVLACVYLIFNEGHTATEGSSLIRPDLCIEADSPRAPGGRAIAGGTGGSRAAGTCAPDRCAVCPARTTSDGLLVPLEEQDRFAVGSGQDSGRDRHSRCGAALSPAGRTRFRPRSRPCIRTHHRPARPTGTRSRPCMGRRCVMRGRRSWN